MEYKKFNMDNYDLYTIVTDRFKTISLKINIRIKNKKENAKYLSMLKRMLISTHYKYNCLKEINKAAASIYDPAYSIKTLNSGREDIISLSASFTNEKYTEIGMNEKNIKFISDFLFNPKIVDGGFDNEIFEIKKEKLLSQLLSIKDHPREYADFRIEEEMDVYGYREYSLDELTETTKDLTNTELYDFYKKIINEGKLDIFVCGNFDPNCIKNIIEKTIKFSGCYQDNPNHIINQTNYRDNYKLIIDDSNNFQSNLIVGCKCVDITDFERKYVFVLYSWILGGGMNSLLNQTVREKNSLCYYIYAVRKNLVGIMKICAGINSNDFDKTLYLIKDEMKNMVKGNFSDELLDGVKNIYYNSLKSIEDYQNDMLGSFISEKYTGSDDIKTRREMMEKITKHDIMKFAKKVHIDTVYLLKGDSK